MFNRAPSSISVPWMTESMEQAKNLLFLIFTRSTHLYGSSLYPFLLQGITFKNEQRSMFKGRRLFIRDESSVINNYTFFSLSFTHVFSHRKIVNKISHFTQKIQIHLSIPKQKARYNRKSNMLDANFFSPLVFPYPRMLFRAAINR